MDQQVQLPKDLILGESHIQFLFINFVDHMRSEENVLTALSHGGFERQARWIPDPEYYSPFASNSPHVLTRIQDYGPTEGITVDSVPNSALALFQSLASTDAGSPLSKLVIPGNVTEEIYLYSSGALCYRVDLHITAEAGVDLLLATANGIAKHNGKFALAGGEVCPAQVFEQLLSRIEQTDEDAHVDASKSERYTIITAVRLSDEAERVLLERPEVRATLYDTYENQIHALSVRTIENWRERFPKGAKFPDKNISTSSVGVVRVNFRNTFIFDFPYSRSTAEKLYAHAIVELRCWAFMLQYFIGETSELIDQLAGGVDQHLLDKVLARRARILDALDDFSSWMLARSFRTRSFMSNAIRIMQLDELTTEIHRKTAILNQLAQDHTTTRQLEQQANLARQMVALSDETKQLQEQQARSGKTLDFINVIVSAAVAFTVAETLGFPWWGGVLSFVALLAAFMWSVRRSV